MACDAVKYLARDSSCPMMELGLFFITPGVIGVLISLRDHRTRGWSYTRLKFVVTSWALLVIGAVFLLISLHPNH